MAAKCMTQFVQNLLEEEKDNLSCLTHRIIRARYEKTVRKGEPLDADDRSLLREIVELHLLLSFKTQSQQDETQSQQVSDCQMAEMDSSITVYAASSRSERPSISTHLIPKFKNPASAKSSASAISCKSESAIKQNATSQRTKSEKFISAATLKTSHKPKVSRTATSPKSSFTGDLKSAKAMQLKDKQSHLDIIDKMLSNPETMTNKDLDVLVNGDVSNFEDGVQSCSEQTDINDNNLSNLELAFNDNLDVSSDDGNGEERSVLEPSSIVEVDSPIKKVSRKRRVLQYSSSEENCESPVKQLNASSSANVSQRVLSIKLKKCDDYFKDIMPPATQQSQQQQPVDVVCKSSPATASRRLEVVCTLVSDSDVECEFVSISQQRSAFHRIVEETDSREREYRLTTSLLAVRGSDVGSSASSSFEDDDDDGDEMPAQLVHLKRINKSGLNSKKRTSKAVKRSTKQSKAVDATNWKKSRKVAELEKLARKCKILPIGRRYTLFYQDCSTEQQHIDRLRQLFEQSGFEGIPSRKQIDKFLLQKEIAELNSSNIIFSTATSRCHRGEQPTNTNRRHNSQSDCFSRLQDIIDCE